MSALFLPIDVLPLPLQHTWGSSADHPTQPYVFGRSQTLLLHSPKAAFSSPYLREQDHGCCSLSKSPVLDRNHRACAAKGADYRDWPQGGDILHGCVLDGNRHKSSGNSRGHLPLAIVTFSSPRREVHQNQDNRGNRYPTKSLGR